MEGSGPFNFGDFQDDPDEAAPEDDILDRAWLPPEDRLWRHPSEVAQHGPPQGRGTRPVAVRSTRREHRFAVTAGVAGAAALATAVVVVVFSLTESPSVVSPARSVTSTSDVSLVTVAAGVTSPFVMEMVSALRPSLIAIRPAKGNKATHMTGIVLPGGDLAVTAAAAVRGASKVDIVTSSGQHRRVQVLGSDPHSGIAVIRTGGGLTGASFADDEVQPGELAIAACLCVSANVEATIDNPPTAVAVGAVRKVGTGTSLSGGTGLVDTIEADMPLGPDPWGGVLLDGNGQVIGILDGQESTGTAGTGVFVPASLAVAVAHELATTHVVEHGWLGIKCSDVPNDGGAKITSIMAGSPAASAGLEQGDVVEAVGSHRVESLADLQARLYTAPPGTTVDVTLVRAGQDMKTSLTLAGTPTG